MSSKEPRVYFDNVFFLLSMTVHTTLNITKKNISKSLKANVCDSDGLCQHPSYNNTCLPRCWVRMCECLLYSQPLLHCLLSKRGVLNKQHTWVLWEILHWEVRHQLYVHQLCKYCSTLLQFCLAGQNLVYIVKVYSMGDEETANMSCCIKGYNHF